MTLDDIEIAAGQHLAALGANDIAWPNASFEPGGRYIEFRHSPTQNNDPVISGGYTYNLGLFLITAVVPAGGFAGAANSLAQSIASHFPKALRIPAGTGNVVITAPASFGSGFQDGAYWRQPVVVQYITEDDAIQPGVQVQATAQTVGTGWSYYIDTAGAQSFTAGVRQKLTINAGIALEGQKPDDVEKFWDAADNHIEGLDGDDRAVRIQITATPVDENASSVRVEFDIGGSQGVIDEKMLEVTSGQQVSQKISEDFELFCGATFEANGCEIYLTFDGDADVTAKTILIKRGHKAI